MMSDHQALFVVYSILLTSLTTVSSQDAVLTLLYEQVGFENLDSFRFDVWMFTQLYNCFCGEDTIGCIANYNGLTEEPFDIESIDSVRSVNGIQSSTNYYECKNSAFLNHVNCTRMTQSEISCGGAHQFTAVPRPSDSSCGMICIGFKWFHPPKEFLTYNSVNQTKSNSCDQTCYEQTVMTTTTPMTTTTTTMTTTTAQTTTTPSPPTTSTKTTHTTTTPSPPTTTTQSTTTTSPPTTTTASPTTTIQRTTTTSPITTPSPPTTTTTQSSTTQPTTASPPTTTTSPTTKPSTLTTTTTQTSPQTTTTTTQTTTSTQPQTSPPTIPINTTVTTTSSNTETQTTATTSSNTTENPPVTTVSSASDNSSEMTTTHLQTSPSSESNISMTDGNTTSSITSTPSNVTFDRNKQDDDDDSEPIIIGVVVGGLLLILLIVLIALLLLRQRRKRDYDTNSESSATPSLHEINTNGTPKAFSNSIYGTAPGNFNSTFVADSNKPPNPSNGLSKNDTSVDESPKYFTALPNANGDFMQKSSLPGSPKFTISSTKEVPYYSIIDISELSYDQPMETKNPDPTEDTGNNTTNDTPVVEESGQSKTEPESPEPSVQMTRL